MPKKMQDIVPNNGRSIRNVPFPRGRSQKEEFSQIPIKKIAEKVERLERKLETEESHLEKEIAHLEKEDAHIKALRKARAEFEMHNLPRRNFVNKKKLWIGGIAVLAIGSIVLISTVFHGASVMVSPKSLSLNVAGDYSADKKASSGGLVFETFMSRQTGTEVVKASGEETVNKKASGTIVVYNNYNSASQRLIKNTRFETPEGLIFRITDSVTVPGKSANKPGSIEALVTADEAGEKYNVGLKDFTIPGFKGDPRYSSFYARSKTELSGGFSGVRKVVADGDRKKVEESIRTKLKASLLEDVKKNVVSGQVFFDKAFTVDFVSLPEESLSGSEVLLKVEGTIAAVVFDQKILSSYLAIKLIKGYQGDEVIIKNPESVFFTPKSDFRPASNQTVSFSLSGTPAFEWVFDGMALANGLAGVDRKDVVSVLQKFPMIEKADISIRPFWRSSFPDSSKRITIKKAE